MTVKIGVGSTNPVKIAAAQAAFTKVWPEITWNAEGFAATSGVSDQPTSDLESIRGATSRAHQAIDYFDAQFGVGMEGGVQQVESQWFDCGWVVVVNKQGIVGIGSTIRLQVPDQMMQLVHQGLELGEVDDRVFGQVNSKQQDGHFGLMTNGIISRQSGYTDGVIAALARFITPEVW